jgi:hypothetical protein
MKNRLLLLIIGVICALLLAACGATANEEDLQPQVASEARLLICSDECARRGQCGQNEAREWVVLGHTDSPHTDNHNVLFPANQEVFAFQMQERQVETIQSGEQFQLRFYHVALPDQTKAGWIAGWCVSTQP